jgi:hypothetical protein
MTPAFQMPSIFAGTGGPEKRIFNDITSEMYASSNPPITTNDAGFRRD